MYIMQVVANNVQCEPQDTNVCWAWGEKLHTQTHTTHTHTQTHTTHTHNYSQIHTWEPQDTNVCFAEGEGYEGRCCHH
jgi:hypothetical protein